jgi:prepilin signal peptidase PulO-like enzyme (type II secretory pathway)
LRQTTAKRPIEEGLVGADERTARRFFLFLLLGVIFLLAVVARPLASALFMAAVIAGAMEPIYRRLAGTGRRRPRLAAEERQRRWSGPGYRRPAL